MKKVGIYSGTFDPVHVGHVAFARQSIHEQGLDKVIFLVEPEPRRKQNVAPYEHRLRMVELAIADEPQMEALALNQPQFAVTTTLPLLKEKLENVSLYLLLGDDLLEHLADWPDAYKLLESVSFIIVNRHHEPEAIATKAKAIEKNTGRALTYEVIKNQYRGTSSRAIRQSLQQSVAAQGLSPSVSRYIEAKHLYKK